MPSPLPQSKRSQLLAALAEGRELDALRIAARFPELGAQAGPIRMAWAAHTSPAVYREMGHDPDSLVAAGIAAVRERYPARPLATPPHSRTARRAARAPG